MSESNPTSPVIVRLASLKDPAAFRARLDELGLSLPCADTLLSGAESPLARPIESPRLNGRRLGNRLAIHPMEGWDGTADGRPSELVFRRWSRFGRSGAKLIFGGEAMAVRPDGRANPRQLILQESTRNDLAELCQSLRKSHRDRFGSDEDLVVGFQLTHSGRFCKPRSQDRFEPRVAFRHPLLDARFRVTDDSQVFTDAELDTLGRDYVEAARVAREAGADFVDLKHCHGYLLHELLGAHTRPGRFGGSFENRTRFLRQVVEGIRAAGNPIDLAVRLSAFDLVPFRPDPETSAPGKPGPGIPEDFSKCLPYRYGFGMDPQEPTTFDLSEPLRFMKLCSELGVKMLNLTAGSPYYNPHLQRPAAYPPSDGYQPMHDPLVDVVRQMDVVRKFKREAPPGLIVVGSAYTYLQEFLPHVAQAAVAEGWTDVVGLGRMVLSYPELMADVLEGRAPDKKRICRTFSDCTTAPRNGWISGCYPLDPDYAGHPEATVLKAWKKGKSSTGSAA